jgi:hypothetical protein
MTAMGWFVVVVAVAVYALLMGIWWRAVTKGPREWLEPEHRPDHACAARERQSKADGGADDD